MHTPDDPSSRHRRRNRPPRDARPDVPADPATGEAGSRRASGPAGGARAERGLRSIVGAGPSQLGVSGALRGRDVNRPTDEDLAEAKRDVVLVRRNWKPPT